mmetsp:Transcript_3168/g.6508  ORF Transcript_3168/g.6508 Transcript_3168/m.6508 type:complete len:259 (+) Transcript_3168:993-1769(+)
MNFPSQHQRLGNWSQQSLNSYYHRKKQQFAKWNAGLIKMYKMKKWRMLSSKKRIIRLNTMTWWKSTKRTRTMIRNTNISRNTMRPKKWKAVKSKMRLSRIVGKMLSWYTTMWPKTTRRRMTRKRTKTKSKTAITPLQDTKVKLNGKTKRRLCKSMTLIPNNRRQKQSMKKETIVKKEVGVMLTMKQTMMMPSLMPKVRKTIKPKKQTMRVPSLMPQARKAFKPKKLSFMTTRPLVDAKKRKESSVSNMKWRKRTRPTM